MINRGFRKIAEAAEAFGYDFRGKTVLDIGSSTGGFTEYALEAGAERVVAVEKGTRQMVAPLRFDPRVELHEKTDFFEFEIPEVDTVVADVSFVSLKRVLSRFLERRERFSGTEFLVMLKPQFEASPEQLNRGVVKNERMRREILREFERWLEDKGFVVLKKRDNELSGRKGNVERFYLVKLASR